jgi:L-aspartate oxidase
MTLHTLSTDVVVIGSGAAGLTTALALAPLSVLVVTKAPALASGSTVWAQGGMAAAMGRDDTPAEHVANTLFAGAGLTDKSAAEVLAAEAPAAMRLLMDWGMVFDTTPEGALSLGQEAAHSQRRILHAGGDATGRHLAFALSDAAEKSNHIKYITECTASEILTNNGGVTGVLVHTQTHGWQVVRCRHVVLATGGVGQVFSHTTNPQTATGDGLRLAWRAGATLADMEFMQFHPTALDVPATEGRRPLLTEALRGEGAPLLDATGHRFMPDEHPDAELAPRDVVARAVWRRKAAGGQVFLDARGCHAAAFPTVWALCRQHGLEPARDLLPIAPAAHYHMGGVLTDLYGRTTVDGLWAAGEVARTGLHGANRLASNSLTECVVFGLRAAMALKNTPRPMGKGERVRTPVLPTSHKAVDVLSIVRERMYAHMGLIRNNKDMSENLNFLVDTENACRNGYHTAATPADHITLQSVLLVARLMTEQALKRTESRGGHYRSDYPQQNPLWQKTLTLTNKDATHDPAHIPAAAVL